MTKPLTYSVDEAAVLLGISRNTAYECIRTGRLRAIHLARRIRVPAAAIEEVIGYIAIGDSPTPEPTAPSDTHNHIEVVGRLTRDAESRIGRSGQAFSSLRIAIRRPNNADLVFIDVVVFGQVVDTASELTKGTLVHVTGRLDQRAWTTVDGTHRLAHQIVASDVGALDTSRSQPAA